MRLTPTLFVRLCVPSLFRRLALLWLPLSAAAQTTHTWQGPNSGAWADPANWSTGIVPNASGDTAAFVATDRDTALAITLPTTPVHVGALVFDNTISAPSVVFTPSVSGSALHLANDAGQPAILVASSPVFLNIPVTGTQGFLKTGPGTLSFRDNPHVQTYTGPIGLGGGRLVLGAGHHLGDADNDLRVTATTTLIADPADAATPLVLGPGHGLQWDNPGATLALANASPAGALELAGPLTGSGPLRFDGPGTLTLSGANPWSGTLTCSLWPGQGGTGLDRVSTLCFVGPDAVGPAGQGLTFGLGTATVTGSSTQARVDLGGQARALNLAIENGTKVTGSSTLIEITNGELISRSSGSTLYILANGAESHTELRLPAVTTLTRDRGTLFMGGSALAQTRGSVHVRIGTRANFNLTSLYMLGSSRLDALAPGSTLRLRDGNGTGGLSMQVGNFASGHTGPVYSILDMADGTLDARISSLAVGIGAPADPATALFKFRDGSLDVTSMSIGNNRASGRTDFTYGVEQLGGMASIQSIHLGYGNATGTAIYRYRLAGGTLRVGNFFSSGLVSDDVQNRFEWSGGAVKNHVPGSAIFLGNSSGSPIEIAVDGSSEKSIEPDAGQSVSLAGGTRLSCDTPDRVLIKRGPGAFWLGGDSTAFSGTLRHEAGTLGFGANGVTLFTAHAGALDWNAGVIACDLDSASQSSDRLVLTRALTRGPGAADARVLQLISAPAAGTYTLATYSSTNLTPAEFTTSGIPAGYSAEFSVGPGALTVTLAAETAFAAWRRIKLAASANTGNAADLADPDADGRANLLEYALGTEPTVGDAEPALVLSLTPSVPQSLQLTFRRIADPALTYTVRAAADPGGPWDEVVFTSTGAANTDGLVTIHDSLPFAEHPRRFLRLVVTR